MQELFKDATILVYTTHCPACHRAKPLYQRVLQKDNLNYVEINADENPYIAEAFKIRAVPTLIFIKNKEELRRFTGIATEEELLETIKQMEE